MIEVCEKYFTILMRHGCLILYGLALNHIGHAGLRNGRVRNDALRTPALRTVFRRWMLVLRDF